MVVAEEVVLGLSFIEPGRVEARMPIEHGLECSLCSDDVSNAVSIVGSGILLRALVGGTERSLHAHIC
jgi:hypothetical protein